MANNKQLTDEQIESFLTGSDPEKYIVAIEPEYNHPRVTLIINEPGVDKKMVVRNYKPFLWFDGKVFQKMYEGNTVKRLESCQKMGVKIDFLRTHDENGFVPKRMENGYKYLAKCDNSFNDLIIFFKLGGIDVFSSEWSKSFIIFSPIEQYLIQTGKRLFKDFDDYNDLHRLQFDLETEGLNGNKNAIFQIGIKDNKNIEHVFDIKGDTPREKRENERKAIKNFFKVIAICKPDIIAGYNSENFDWPFLFERANRLGIDMGDIAISLDNKTKIKRKPSTLKLGGETEAYTQTYLYGYNILDISHAVRRAMAINSEIKGWGLKYITKYSDIAKPNRVYVSGDKINSTWADKINQYAFNNETGDWYKITQKKPLIDGYQIVTGEYIVERYLCDDLWETEQIDYIYNQASFLISKIIPTSFMRSSTMGTAGQWKLIMAAWSYQNGLAIPETQPKKKFTGGLSRLLQVGYAKNVVKLDFAALYPKTQLTWGIFPDLDISGVMKGLLTYVVNTRDYYKNLTEVEKKTVKKLTAQLESNKKNMTEEEISLLKKEISKHKQLKSLYDKKQLPLKILANSWFGSYGAPYIFNWGDTDSAEETTCRGRQSLRLMVKHFTEKHGFKPLVGDSVTYDTPVYIRYKTNKKYIDVLPICDLFNENSKYLDSESLRDFEEKPFEVLTRNGWKDLKYIYRHGTDKKIHRITTKDRLINVTEDHSLFQNGVEIKPSELKRFDVIDTYEIPKNNVPTGLNLEKAYLYGFFLGDGSANCSSRKQKYTSRKTNNVNINNGKRSDWKISNSRIELLEKLKEILKKEFSIDALIKNHINSSGVYNLVVHNADFTKSFCENFYTSYREKKIPYMILNATEDVKKAFIEGVFASDGYGDSIDDCSDIGMKSQVAMAGISMLLKELNIDFKIKTRKDKENFISFNLKNRNRNNSPFTDKTKKKTNEVWKNEIISNKDKNNYVYDISTEDGTFVCGINGIIAHNTDGFNFAFPDNVDEIKYVAKGNHWKTKDYGGQELIGLEAVLADFNENYMVGYMGLDIDEICTSTINFARKNYANLIDGKIKMVGNSIKSKKISGYIEDFLNEAIKLLLSGKGYEFVNLYYDYVDKIYNYQIPLIKMASKAKIKSTIEDYKKKATMKNKAGNPMPKQAHMELAIREDIIVTLGDTLYYINTGKSKRDGDLKTFRKSKMSKKQLEKFHIENGYELTSESEVKLNCRLIDNSIVERDFEMIKELEMLKKAIEKNEDDQETISSMKSRIEEINKSLYVDDYNVGKYLESFNKKVKPLLVCFHPDIRNNILIDIIKVKDKETKVVTEKLKDKIIFTENQCELVSGMPFKESHQDTYQELMTMEDKEISFWIRTSKVPNFMDENEWETIKNDYIIRMEKLKEDGVKEEKELLDNIFKKLEVSDFDEIQKTGLLPVNISIMCDIRDEKYFVSKKWEEILCEIKDIFKYEKEAVKRQNYYLLTNSENDDNKYQNWLDYLEEQRLFSGSTNNLENDDNHEENYDSILKNIKVVETISELIEETPKKTKNASEDDEDYDDTDDESDEESDDIAKTNHDDLQLDDEIDDTILEKPEEFIPNIEIKNEEIDEWGF